MVELSRKPRVPSQTVRNLPIKQSSQFSVSFCLWKKRFVHPGRASLLVKPDCGANSARLSTRKDHWQSKESFISCFPFNLQLSYFRSLVFALSLYRLPFFTSLNYSVVFCAYFSSFLGLNNCFDFLFKPTSVNILKQLLLSYPIFPFAM